MKLDFDFKNVKITEFGVGCDDNDKQVFSQIPVDIGVQNVLRGMAEVTYQKMLADTDAPSSYEPSEKHGSIEYLTLPLHDDMTVAVRDLHDASNMQIDNRILSNPALVFAYFARFTDNKGRRLTALRRASQFKGILKKRLLQFVNDSLKIIDDKVFKLDNDFDLLIDSSTVHILRPSGFEAAGKLQEAILSSVPQNTAAIQKNLVFIDFTGIQEYAYKHPRAARYLASIKGLQETKNVDKNALKNICKKTGVVITDTKGKIIIHPGHEMGFLEVLDRRRYELELVKNQPERFKAASRKKIVE